MKLKQITEKQPTLYVPIAASGSGKSTVCDALVQSNPEMLIFSLDRLRHEWYDPDDYKKAWEASAKDSQFMSKANKLFQEMIKAGKDIFVDNTNLTPKRRSFYLAEANKNNYYTVAITFDIDLETIIARQKTRGDKEVPEKAVILQYESLTPPLHNEFDEEIDSEKIIKRGKEEARHRN